MHVSGIYIATVTSGLDGESSSAETSVEGTLSL